MHRAVDEFALGGPDLHQGDEFALGGHPICTKIGTYVAIYFPIGEEGSAEFDSGTIEKKQRGLFTIDQHHGGVKCKMSNEPV
jgi:hypothetical protein